MSWMTSKNVRARGAETDQEMVWDRRLVHFIE